MQTAQQLITRAYLLLNAVDSGEDPTADESADGLLALNEMLANWAEDDLSVPYRTLDSVTLSATDTYTWGTGGDINSDRPVSIDTAWLEESETSSPFEISMGLREYSRIASKGVSGKPSSGWYESQYPLGLLTLDSVPDTAYMLKIWSIKQFTEFSSLSAESDLPGSYTRAIRYNLALELAGELQAPVHVMVERIARDSLRKLKGANLAKRTNKLEVDAALLPRREIISF